MEENERMRLSLEKAQRNIISLSKQNKEFQESIEADKQKICLLSNENEKLKQRSKQYIFEHNELILSKEEVEFLKKAMENQVTSLKQELVNATTSYIKDIQKLEAQIQKNEETIQLKNREIENLNNEIESVKSQLDDACEEAKRVRSEYNSLSEKFSILEKQNKAKENQVTSLKPELANKIEDIQELEAQIQKNEEIIQSKSREIESLNNEIESVKSQLDNACEEAKRVRSENDSLSEKLLELDKQNKALHNKHNDLSKEYSNLQKRLEDLEKSTKKECPQGIGGKVTTPTVIKKTMTKSKEEEVIKQSGNCIIDFPPIINDSNKEVQRKIKYIFDENGIKVEAKDFFDRTAEQITHVSRKMSEAEISGKIYWTCGLCRHRIKIAHRTYNGKESLFFIHATKNRDHYCPWIEKSTGPKYTDEESILADDDKRNDEIQEEFKPKSRELKEKIFSLLSSHASMQLGISDVKMDEIIKSKVPYMRWRRPDISFIYNGKIIVIELQKYSQNIDAIVDRDVFFRLNDIQILWIFGSDNDYSYDYMRKLNYKNTMFDNHRNVFVFDKEAQSKSEEKNMLFLKCNWLNKDDSWHFTIENSGINGKLVNIENFIFDDEYCKPYYYDANEEYFSNQPQARDAYLVTKMTRKELKRAIEDKWMRDVNYEAAQIQMRQRNTNAKLFSVNNLWGFRFNETVIIPPIFTVEPKDLYNGHYLVQQGSNMGIVNYFGEKIVNWDGYIQCEDLNYDSVNKLLFFKRDSLWGIADLSANELIPASYHDIKFWTISIYKVQKNGKWGLCNIMNKLVCNCIYNKIGDFIDSRALAIKTHPTKEWKTVTGYIDINGKELYSSKSKQKDGLSIIQAFELWGLLDEKENIVLPCQYEEIIPWAKYHYKVKENSKWGIYNVEKQEFTLDTTYDSIGEIQNGVAKIVFANTENYIDITGKEVAQENIQLQNGLKKTKIAGKWGITNLKGEVLVNHLYDEIGSFRSRMIGVINGRIIKLNTNYEYPIYISGKYINSTSECHFFNIAGVKCMLPKPNLQQMNKKISQICDVQKVCNQLAFANLIVSKQHCILRLLKPENLTKKLSHADVKDNFSLGEILSAKIISFKVSGKGVKRKTKAMVDFSDGKKAMVPRRFFDSSHSIDKYNIGDTISLKKIGYDDELDQTIWEVKKPTIVK